LKCLYLPATEKRRKLPAEARYPSDSSETNRHSNGSATKAYTVESSEAHGENQESEYFSQSMTSSDMNNFNHDHRMIGCDSEPVLVEETQVVKDTEIGNAKRRSLQDYGDDIGWQMETSFPELPWDIFSPSNIPDLTASDMAIASYSR
jgi:hypothetical protein